MNSKNIYAVLYAFRWVMLVFYGGLAIALCGFAAGFALKLYSFMSHIADVDEIELILKVLGLIDGALVGGLVVMVMLSGYSTFVDEQGETENHQWLNSISFSALKMKFASTLLAIGAISLLETALEQGTLNANNIIMGSIVELVLTVVVLAFALVDWLSHQGHAKS